MTFQELEAMKLQELRTMGKELGVDSPTTYPKRELVLKIMEKNGIVVDQNDLPAPPKRRGGRPRKIRPGEELPVPDIVEPEADESVQQMELPGVHPLEPQRAPKPAQTPFQPRSGIKPAVSEILNEGECGCPKREIDPRLSVLADLLKD